MLIIVGLPTASSAEEAKAFTPWLNEEVIVREVKVAISTRSNANQSEAPSVAGNSSSLVDTSSASDLIGMALNVAGLTADSTDTESDATTATATASAYVLYSALRGIDPLDSANYCGSGSLGPAKYWRRVSFTLGFDDNENKTQKSPVIVGGKAILWTKRDVCSTDFSKVQKALETATARAGQLSTRIQDQLYDLYRNGQLGVTLVKVDAVQGDNPDDERRRRVAFIQELGDAAVFDQILQSLGADGQRNLLTTEDFQAFVTLDKTARDEIDAFRGQPQLSASLQTKQREMQADDYRVEAIFDYGLNDRMVVSLNGSYEATDGAGAGSEDGHGGRVATAFQVEPFRDPLFGPKPLRFSLSGEGKWMEGTAPTYKGQLKVNLPVPAVQWLTGFEVPLSVTIANRTELVDEVEVRGLVGFTIDTSQLLAALRNS